MTPPYSKADKVVSDALIDRWEKAEKDKEPEWLIEAIKRALTHLGLPWVRL